jgi:hypothetical protein
MSDSPLLQERIGAAPALTLRRVDRERDVEAKLLFSADHAEGKAAFAEKRPPRYVGR